MFLGVVDDIVKNTACRVFDAESLSESSLLFLDLNALQFRMIKCHGYRKKTDTGTKLSNRSCVPPQNKRTVVQSTVHRVFRVKSGWC